MNRVNSSVCKSPGRQISSSASNSPLKCKTMSCDKQSIVSSTLSSKVTKAITEYNSESEQLRSEPLKSSSVSLSSSDITKLHSSCHPVTKVTKQQSMDQLLEKLKDEMTELGNQGDAYTAQILSMYATFEDLMHNNSSKGDSSLAFTSSGPLIQEMANVTQLRESFELTLLNKSKPPVVNDKSTSVHCSSSTGSSRKSSASSIQSTSSTVSSSSTSPCAPVKSPRKSLESSPKPIPQPRTSRSEQSKYPPLTMPVSEHISGVSSSPSPLLQRRQVEQSLQVKYSSNSTLREVSEDGHFVGEKSTGVCGGDRERQERDASIHRVSDNNGVVNSANNNSGVSSYSPVSVRPSKQPLVTPVTPSTCNCCNVHTCKSSCPAATLVSSPKVICANESSSPSINNSLLDTISTLHAPYSDTDDDDDEDADDDDNDCDNEDDDDVTNRITDSNCTNINTFNSTGSKLNDDASKCRDNSHAATVTSVYQRNLLRPKRKSRKSHLIRSRSPCHLSSSDGDSVTGGYAGSNSIDSGYKSFCPTPDQVSDSSVQSNDSNRAKLLLGSKKKSLTLGCNANASLASTCNASPTINSIYTDQQSIRDALSTSLTGDKMIKSGTLGVTSSSNSGMYANKIAARFKQHATDAHLEHLLSLRHNLINAIHRVGSSTSNHSNTVSPIPSRGNSPVVSSRSNSPAVTVIAAARAAGNNHPSTSSSAASSTVSSHLHSHHHVYQHHGQQFHAQQSPLAGNGSPRRFLPQTPTRVSSESIDFTFKHSTNDPVTANDAASSVSLHPSSSALYSSDAPSRLTNSPVDGKMSTSANGASSLMNKLAAETLSSSSSSSAGASKTTAAVITSSSSSLAPNQSNTVNQPFNKCVRFDKDVKVTSFAQLSCNPEEMEDDNDGESVQTTLTDGTLVDLNKNKLNHLQHQQQQHLHKESINCFNSDKGKSAHTFNYSNLSRGLHLNSVLNSSLNNSNSMKCSLTRLNSQQQLPLVHGSTATTTVTTMSTLTNVKSNTLNKQSSASSLVDSGASAIIATKSILRDPICETMRSKVKSGEFTNDTSSSIESEIDSLLFGSSFTDCSSSHKDASDAAASISVTLEPFSMRDDDDIPYVTMIEEKYRSVNKSDSGDNSSQCSLVQSKDSIYGKVEDAQDAIDVPSICSASSSSCSSSSYESNGKSHPTSNGDAGENEKAIASKFVHAASLVSSSSGSLASAATVAAASRSASSEKLIINQITNHQTGASGLLLQANRLHGDPTALPSGQVNNGDSLVLRERVERIINERSLRMQQQQQQQQSRQLTGLNEYGGVINYTKGPNNNNESPSASVSPASSYALNNLTGSTSDGSMTPASSIADASCLSSQSSTDEGDSKNTSLGVSSSATSLSSGQSSASGVIVPSATISAILDKHLKRNKKKSTSASVNCTLGNYTDVLANGQVDMTSKMHTEAARCPAIPLSSPGNGAASTVTTSPAAATAALDTRKRLLVATSSNSSGTRNSDLESVHSYSTLPELHIYEEVAEDNYQYNQHDVMYPRDQSTGSEANRQCVYNRQSINAPFACESGAAANSLCHMSPINLSSIDSHKRRGNIFTLMRDSEAIASSKLSMNGSNDIINDTSTGGTSSVVNECEYGFEATV